MYQTIHAPGCVDYTSTGDNLHPWGSPLGDAPTLHAHGHDLCLQAHDGNSILPGHPSFLSPLEGRIPGSRICKAGWVCWRCIPNWTCFSTPSHVRHANLQKLTDNQGCGGCKSFSLCLSSYNHIQLLFIPCCMVACSRSRLSVMHRGVSTKHEQMNISEHICKLYIWALSSVESFVVLT